MAANKKRLFSVWNLSSILILAVFLLFILFPLVLVLKKSIFDPHTGELTLSYFSKFFERKFYWITLVNSFKVTLVTTALSVAIGLPIAYVMRKVKIRGSKYLQILIIISYLSPPFIGAYAWIQLLGRNGVITQFINDLFHVQLNGIYGFPGIVLVMTLQSFPLIYIYISGALQNLDNSLNEAAESLGYSAVQRVFKIIIPLIMPTVLASALLVFMRVIADFGTPMLIGEGFRTMPVLIYTQFMSEVGGDDGFAAALCVLIILLTICLFMVQRILARYYSYSMSALKPMVPEQSHGMKNIIAHGAVYFTVLLAILPQCVVIFTSFLATRGGQVFTSGFSLNSYRDILFNKDTSVIFNTYLIGIAAILIIVVCGIMISYLTVRKRNALTSTLDTISMFPFIIPGSVLGIAFLFAFSQSPLLLSGTMFIMIMAFAIRRMPYTIRSSTAIISQISPSIEEAAISLGASESKAFTRVIVPMMMPGVIAGAIMSWITVISELSASIILYTSKTQTLTVSVYTEVIRGNYGNASAYSTILTLTSILSLILFFKLTGKKDISV
ncbi:iron ABC transporter permease [Paenibacillus thiaminolyticus]|uniref:Iron ABC transporter permease n=1 Tax=Paenibacillus thiaminolyticus TaxID=49283 RepID=A0AAP9DSB8_PANTH|nr:iron ABC transporter permease [Paenibacillus thiaminolyticus]MCY9536452.1 iron ABC transporter permease [Paenibacillus thiaminolyticus]MCY9601464.1 iron ABC transporter permease [Paenibacillus thiaminolyticus]MCY9610212.1 iron ABC transporter permease [Paenibacillus thiaminolyticus]MCY9616492.1 iron ABC transporter permease [Paenibacillus thiaminolyticus]MCY9616897.1 iron ABC transporter permease [Paenibacillus thiaminolyticus]